MDLPTEIWPEILSHLTEILDILNFRETSSICKDLVDSHLPYIRGPRISRPYGEFEFTFPIRMPMPALLRFQRLRECSLPILLDSPEDIENLRTIIGKFYTDKHEKFRYSEMNLIIRREYLNKFKITDFAFSERPGRNLYVYEELIEIPGTYEYYVKMEWTETNGKWLHKLPYVNIARAAGIEYRTETKRYEDQATNIFVCGVAMLAAKWSHQK